MSDPNEAPEPRTADFQSWEDAAEGDKQTHQERVASEVFLAALGTTESFRKKIFLKGGVLVGAVYESGRNTADLDFSTIAEPSRDFLDQLEAEIVAALPAAAARVGSPDTVLKVQSVKYRPRKDTFVEANAPAIEVKFAYADKGTKGERRLIEGKSSNVIYADISFNEEIENIQEIYIGQTGVSFFAYSKIDLVAEKLRSVLQQKTRNRNRRQDIYDLWYLIENHHIDDEELQKIKEAFLKKAASRDMAPTEHSFNDPEIRDRSSSDWDTLAAEVSELPEFSAAFDVVSNFYQRLWLAD